MTKLESTNAAAIVPGAYSSFNGGMRSAWASSLALFEAPDEPVVDIDDLADALESALLEHALRRLGIRQRVRAHDADLGTFESVRDERGGGLGRITAVALLERHAVRNFDDAAGRRPLEAAAADHRGGVALHERIAVHPRIDGRRRGEPREPNGGELLFVARAHRGDACEYFVARPRHELEVRRLEGGGHAT